MQIYQRHRVCHGHFNEEFRITLPSRTESQPTYEDVSGNNENINLNNLPSYSSAVNVIFPNKEVLQEEQSQRSIKETPRKARISYSGLIRKFGSSRQTYLSDEAKDIYKKKSRFANISSSLRAELQKNLFEHVNKPTVDFFSQLANQPKTPKARRFTIQEKVFAIALLKSSDLYYIDREAPMRICPRLTEQHVISGNINNMKVKSCTQVFSYTEASHLVTFSKWNKKYSSELVPLEFLDLLVVMGLETYILHRIILS
ncbi:hypothetical protein GWI33_008442 [Rhynchophorus ferrugineus]|uniref:THAP-type domain-containing protein n=1 Tax=Rhynchophorus ferrugineus TaxID=354439 RepID=A0A834ICJ5_RHYFE|nr:hypothetical protein GWI33_008442 [Rhynchophorus ferrugineus]